MARGPAREGVPRGESISRLIEDLKMSIGLELCLFEEGFSLHLIQWFVKLRFLNRWAWPPEEMMESWGFSIIPEDWSIHFHWGDRYRIVNPLGRWSHVSTTVMRPDESFVAEQEEWRPEHRYLDGRLIEFHPYRHVCKSGEVQNAIAEICVERREWRWKWWKIRLPWPRKVRKSLEISFNMELGDKAGSWKGGCVGCGWDLQDGEQPIDSLRRMERERTFR
jgi:hypothetical protein